MKTFLKILGFILGILAILVAIWYFYFFKRFSTLQDNDRQTILESLKPDTTGKGYSDDGQKIIDHDLVLAKKSLTPKDYENFEFWYKELLKRKRVVVLSENRDVFLKNLKIYYIAFKCFAQYAPQLDKNIWFLEKNSEIEKENFNYIFESLQKKNFRFLEFKEIFDIQNPIREFDLDQCFKEIR